MKYQHEGSTEFETSGNQYTYIKCILQHTYFKCTQNINIIILMWKERWILGRITSHDYRFSFADSGEDWCRTLKGHNISLVWREIRFVVKC